MVACALHPGDYKTVRALGRSLVMCNRATTAIPYLSRTEALEAGRQRCDCEPEFDLTDDLHTINIYLRAVMLLVDAGVQGNNSATVAAALCFSRKIVQLVRSDGNDEQTKRADELLKRANLLKRTFDVAKQQSLEVGKLARCDADGKERRAEVRRKELRKRDVEITQALVKKRQEDEQYQASLATAAKRQQHASPKSSPQRGSPSSPKVTSPTKFDLASGPPSPASSNASCQHPEAVTHDDASGQSITGPPKDNKPADTAVLEASPLPDATPRNQFASANTDDKAPQIEEESDSIIDVETEQSAANAGHPSPNAGESDTTPLRKRPRRKGARGRSRSSASLSFCANDVLDATNDASASSVSGFEAGVAPDKPSFVKGQRVRLVQTASEARGQAVLAMAGEVVKIFTPKQEAAIYTVLLDDGTKSKFSRAQLREERIFEKIIRTTARIYSDSYLWVRSNLLAVAVITAMFVLLYVQAVNGNEIIARSALPSIKRPLRSN